MEICGAAREIAEYNMIGRMRIAYRITEATDTFKLYIILTAFPLQQWLHERASILHLYVQYIFF